MKLNVRWALCRSCIYTVWFGIKNYGLDFAVSYSLSFHLKQGQFPTGMSTETEWRVKWNDCNKPPSLCNKNKATASRKSLAFSMQERKEQCIEIATRRLDISEGFCWWGQWAWGWDTWGVFGTSSLAPAPGRGWSTQRLPGPLLPVPGWSSTTIWRKMQGTGQRQIQCHHFVVTGHLLFLTHGKAGNVKMWNLQLVRYWEINHANKYLNVVRLQL